MTIFKGGGVYDYTELQRRGLLKLKEKKSNYKMSSQGYVELAETKTVPETAPQQSELNPFSFLDAPVQPTSQTQTNQVDITDVKVKLEDLEYKLERFIERLEKLESQIESFAAKLS